MKGYFVHFIKDDDGMETIEFIAVLVVVAGLIAVIASLGASLNDRADKQISKIKGDLDQIG